MKLICEAWANDSVAVLCKEVDCKNVTSVDLVGFEVLMMSMKSWLSSGMFCSCSVVDAD
jgi:hypothetical protein